MINKFLFFLTPSLQQIKKKQTKGPNWLKYLILFVLSLIVFYFLFPYLPYIYSFDKQTKVYWLIIIAILKPSYDILYKLISLLTLVKFTQMKDKDIIIPNYLPEVIKDYLLELKEISQFKNCSVFIKLYLKGIIFSFGFIIMSLLIIPILFLIFK